jgi:two-component system, sensor histidine kinase PdtaS
MAGRVAGRVADGLPEAVLDAPATVATSFLATEANHRIANNLTIIAGLIRSEIGTLPADALIDRLYIRHALQQISLRIDAVGRLHRLLTNVDDNGNVVLSAYLRQIADAAILSLANTRSLEILLKLEDDIVMSAKRAAQIGLLVGEALTNSIKHARPSGEPGTVWITCNRRDTDRVVVEIIDNGMGLPADLLPMQAMGSGLGMRLMRGLARDLQGELSFIDVDPGHVVRLTLPVKPSYNHC